MFEPINVYTITNSELNSNTYILWRDSSGWLIDPGDVEPIQEFCIQNHLSLKGILLTHYHFDHIYGINGVREIYGNLPIYCGQITREGLLDARVNQSLYNGNPFVIEDLSINIIGDGNEISLYNSIFARALYTPGHNDDCFSYVINDMIFTGDALIPHVKVHTRSKKADKFLAQQTVEMILRDFATNTTIYPGHKEPCKIIELR